MQAVGVLVPPSSLPSTTVELWPDIVDSSLLRLPQGYAPGAPLAVQPPLSPLPPPIGAGTTALAVEHARCHRFGRPGCHRMGHGLVGRRLGHRRGRHHNCHPALRGADVAATDLATLLSLP